MEGAAELQFVNRKMIDSDVDAIIKQLPWNWNINISNKQPFNGMRNIAEWLLYGWNRNQNALWCAMFKHYSIRNTETMERWVVVGYEVICNAKRIDMAFYCFFGVKIRYGCNVICDKDNERKRAEQYCCCLNLLWRWQFEWRINLFTDSNV